MCVGICINVGGAELKATPLDIAAMEEDFIRVKQTLSKALPADHTPSAQSGLASTNFCNIFKGS